MGIALGSQVRPAIDFKECLNLQEYEAVKERFTTIFNWLMESYVVDGDHAEISAHIGKYYAMFRLYKSVVPEVVEDYNQYIFTAPLVRDFHLELLERFSLEVAAIGDRVFERLINTLANAAQVCKAQTVEKRKDGLAPVLLSINRSSNEVVQVYLNNPWLVTLTLLNTQFKRTELGKERIKATAVSDKS